MPTHPRQLGPHLYGTDIEYDLHGADRFGAYVKCGMDSIAQLTFLA